LIVTLICEAVPKQKQRQQIVDAIHCLWSTHGDAIRKLASLTKEQEAARARAAREASSKRIDILIAGLVQRKMKKMTKARSGDALARDIMNDLNKLLKVIEKEQLDHSAIAKRIRKNRSRWQMEEQLAREFEGWLRQPLASDDFMKPLRAMLRRADR
jgi:gamma-glutamylcysteine synthetase